MKQLLTALIKAKADFLPIKKDKINPHFKSRYADLDSILSACEPALLINGLVISQTIELSESGMILTTTLWHESGESLISKYALPQIADSQKFGSALTYARRYAVSALLSVTADDDDDGNSSQSAPQSPQAKANKPQASPERASLMQESKDLFALYGYDINSGVAFLERTFNVTNRNQLSDSQLRELIDRLNEENKQKVAK